MSLLAACPLFSALPEATLRELACVARPRRNEAQQALFRFGDASDSAFVLSAGHAQARVRPNDGRDLVLHVAGPGEAPGYLDLLDESPRSVDAVAQDDVEVLVLPARGAASAPAGSDGAVGRARRDREGLGELSGDLVFLDLSSRLAKLLLQRPASDHRVELGVTQGELAARDCPLRVEWAHRDRAVAQLALDEPAPSLQFVRVGRFP